MILVGGWVLIDQRKGTAINQTPPKISSTKTESQKETGQTVPLPTEEDIIRTYFNLINEKRIPEAIEMMSQKAVQDDSSKQAWGVQLNAIRSIKVESIKPCQDEFCILQENQKEFEVSLQVEVDPKTADAPIPYYGWNEGSNLRWVILEKEGNLWKVLGIGTGP